jgi:hypothetical protein
MLVQAQRPQLQTVAQAHIIQVDTRGAANLSAGAVPALEAAFSNTSFLSLIANLTALKNYTPGQLVDMVQWEMHWGLPLVHSGPLEGQSGLIPDDSDLQTAFSNYYLQNPYVRWLLGAEIKGNYNGEGVRRHTAHLPALPKIQNGGGPGAAGG